MSAVACQYCPNLRKVEQTKVFDGIGHYWLNPPCAHCGAPGWWQPVEADPSNTQPAVQDSER